ncbi:MAG: hypothetical protein ACE5K1_06680 [Acidiferrobacterales bacterium]
MKDSSQYLRLRLGGAHYLLTSSASLTIEQRQNLTLNSGETGNVGAWHSQGEVRWPAYPLDQDLRVTRQCEWESAIFLDARPQPVGLLVGNAQMLSEEEAEVTSFTPVGPAPTGAGHLFAGAWVRGSQVVLVLEPAALIAYLTSLGG